MLVIDFFGAVNNGCNFQEAVCGGRHREVWERYDAIFRELAQLGCQLVFFSDLNVQPDKITTWLDRRAQEVGYYTDVYDGLMAEQTLDEILSKTKFVKPFLAHRYTISQVARRYGEYKYCSAHECDLELARYAAENDALAVVSNDTDFLIFGGSWRFWTWNDFTIQLNAMEYNRNGIAELLGLSAAQRPLLATLMGNDMTKAYELELSKFHNSLGKWQFKFHNVAGFIRQMQNNRLTLTDLKMLARRIFNDESLFTLLKDSIDSYYINYAIEQIDPIVTQLADNPMAKDYLELTGTILAINLPYCDLRHRAANLTILLTDFVKRNIGILRQHEKNTSFTFTLLSRRTADRDFEATIEHPIYPECKYFEKNVSRFLVIFLKLYDFLIVKVPPIKELYFGHNRTVEEMRWKIFEWTTSMPPNFIEKLKNIQKNHLLIVAVLCVLVQVYYTLVAFLKNIQCF